MRKSKLLLDLCPNGRYNRLSKGCADVAKVKIIVITTDYLYQFLKEAYSSFDIEAEIEIVVYKNFSNIADVYRAKEKEADGFIVSGSAAHQALVLQVGSTKKPVVFFNADHVALYRAVLRQIIKNKSLLPNRILMGMGVEPIELLTCDYMLDENKVAFVDKRIHQWIETMSLKDLLAYEEQTVEEITQWWNEGRMDLVICQFSSILKTLQERGVPCIYAYPSRQHLRDTADSLIREIKAQQAKKNLPAVISISPVAQPGGVEMENCLKQLESQLAQVDKRYGGDMIIQRAALGCDVFTKYSLVSYLTGCFTKCALSKYFQEHLPFTVCIGYGVGASISAAKSHAMKAKREAFQHKGSFGVDEHQRMYGPLNAENTIIVDTEVTPEIQEMAQKSQLSTLTIQKLISMVNISGSSYVTTQEIAQRFKVTPRNANRILSSLEKGGLAWATGKRAAQTKGRPTTVYHLNLNGNL